MMRFKYSKIERAIEFNNSLIYDLVIENPNLLYNFVLDLINKNDETIILSNDGEVLEIRDQYMIITDPYTVDPNVKKYINQVYKNSEEKYLNDDRRVLFKNIQDQINNLLNEISLDFNTSIQYRSEIPLSDIMDIANFKIATNFSSMMNRLISFLRAIQETSKTKFVFIVGFLDIIKDEEMDAFLKEISFLDLTLVNISSRIGKFNKDNVVTYILDNELCEF